MARIKKLTEGGRTVYPASIIQAVKDGTTGESLDGRLNTMQGVLTGRINTVEERINTVEGALVGNKTPEGGEVFNEYSENIAHGLHSHAEGNGTSAIGAASHAEGENTVAKGNSSSAKGGNTKAIGLYSASEGFGNEEEAVILVYEKKSPTTVLLDTTYRYLYIGDVISFNSNIYIVENVSDIQIQETFYKNVTFDKAINLEAGANNIKLVSGVSYGNVSHTENGLNIAIGYNSHAEGFQTKSIGTASHSEGNGTMAKNDYEHAEGSYNHPTNDSISTIGIGFGEAGGRKNARLITKDGSYFLYGTGNYEGGEHEGCNSLQEIISNHSTGISTLTEKSSAMEIDVNNIKVTYAGRITPQGGEIFNDYEGNKATFLLSSAKGQGTEASNVAASAEGGGTIAKGGYSHAEGYMSAANGTASHAEGGYVTEIGGDTPIQGGTANGIGSHAEGLGTIADGLGSHAEGNSGKSSGFYAHAEGANCIASGHASHAEGYLTESIGDGSHAEGGYLQIVEEYSIKGGTARGKGSHAEGVSTEAIGDCSHAEGRGTITNNDGEHASGIYNVSNAGTTSDKRTQYSVGIGTSAEQRKNSVEVMANGDTYILGVGGYDGTNATIESVKTVQQVIAAQGTVEIIKELI